MLGWDQGTDKMTRPLLYLFQVIFGIVALVKHQGDIAHLISQDSAPISQFLGDAAESRGVMLIAGVGVMKQRNFSIGSDKQSQSHDPKIVTALLAVPTLRQLVSGIEAINE